MLPCGHGDTRALPGWVNRDECLYALEQDAHDGLAMAKQILLPDIPHLTQLTHGHKSVFIEAGLRM